MATQHAAQHFRSAAEFASRGETFVKALTALAAIGALLISVAEGNDQAPCILSGSRPSQCEGFHPDQFFTAAVGWGLAVGIEYMVLMALVHLVRLAAFLPDAIAQPMAPSSGPSLPSGHANASTQPPPAAAPPTGAPRQDIAPPASVVEAQERVMELLERAGEQGLAAAHLKAAVRGVDGGGTRLLQHMSQAGQIRVVGNTFYVGER